MNCFFPIKNSTETDNIARTGLKLTCHGIKHHHSYLSQDCGNELLKNYFSDSTLASKIHCGRTKITALVKKCLRSIFNRISFETAKRHIFFYRN